MNKFTAGLQCIKRMKNLFSINKTEGRDQNEFDPTPYMAARVSEAVQNKLKHSFSVMEDDLTPAEMTEEDKALKKKGSLYWALCLGLLGGSFLLFFAGDRLGLYAALPALHVVDAGFLVAALVFHFKARRITRRQTEATNNRVRMDFTEATKLLEEAAADAARELGVPDTALSVDILPYHYIVRGDTLAPAGKKNRFDNLSVSLFTRDGALCLATAQERFDIPLVSLRGYREYDSDFEIEMWLKPEDSDADKYQDFGIRRSGILGRKCRGYCGIDVAGEYEILIPRYDFEPTRELLGLAKLD